MNKFLLFFIPLFFTPISVSAIEIDATPEKLSFEPNDWITVFLKIDGYTGGEIMWSADTPNNSTKSGTLSSYSGTIVKHTITRTAFDNLFGNWDITYSYKNNKKTISVYVEPLVIGATLDKEVYHEGDILSVSLTTNYHEPVATKAEDYFLRIDTLNGKSAQHMLEIRTKAYQHTTTQKFPITELLANNPFGKYNLVVQYFNVIKKIPFEVQPSTQSTSIFVGSEKSLYNIGEKVELQIVVSDILEDNAKLTIIDPLGKVLTRTISIDKNLSRLTVGEASTQAAGTYDVQLEYSGLTEFASFVVSTETNQRQNLVSDLILTIDKTQYRPGETILANIQTNTIVAGNLNYWLEDPLGKTQKSFSISLGSDDILIPVRIPATTPEGPWKINIEYGGKLVSDFFVVEGEPIKNQQIISDLDYQGPKILLEIKENLLDMNAPSGLFVDSQNIFVSDYGNSEIKKFDLAGRLIDSWGSFGSDDGDLKNPTGILVESNFVHVVDTGNSRIQTFDKNGNHLRSWGSSSIESQSLKNPTSLTKDKSGIFFVSDRLNDKILKFDADGGYEGEINYIDTAAAKFSSSDFIVIDGKGNLLILVSKDNRVLHYRTDGSFVKSIGTEGSEDGKLNNPTSLALDSLGNLYVGDSGNNRIQVYDLSGKFLKNWGTKGSGPGKFNNISGISIDSSDNIFVLDSENKMIQKFSSIESNNVLKIPQWIRNNAHWWHEGQITDDEFARGIEFLIDKKIVTIPNLSKADTVEGKVIPNWIRSNAKWWADGLISDQEFANGIEFLVKNGIIHV